MSKTYYCEINLHLVWHAKESYPLLSETIEPLAHAAIRRRLVEMPGVMVHEIGGTETHIHMAISIPPTVTISDLVGRVKGGSSHDVNERIARRDKVLQWQTGYGVVSFGTGDLPWVVNYIREQREHHARATAQERLERFTNDQP